MHVDDEFQMRYFLFTVVIKGLVVEKVSQKYFQVSVDVDLASAFDFFVSRWSTIFIQSEIRAMNNLLSKSHRSVRQPLTQQL